MLLYSFADRICKKLFYAFCAFWLITFIIYLPAAKAGFVSDTTGWVKSLTQDSFWDYINRANFKVKSMYQVTQFNTWLIYKIIGLNHWAWHILFVSLHAIVCTLLFSFFRKMLLQAGVDKAHYPVLAGTLIFCISPYCSEVVVWEASFHYFQALILIFGILILVQKFQQEQKGITALAAGILFFISTFTHELFYLTPLLTLSLILFYKIALKRDIRVLRKSFLCFTLPQLGLFVLYLGLFRLLYGSGTAHIGGGLLKNPAGYYLVKPPWYFFHLFAWGRFFPHEVRVTVYDVFRKPIGAVAFYSTIAFFVMMIALRLKKMTVYWKVVSYAFILVLIAQTILMPTWFPEDLLVYGDRYLYLILAFGSMLVALVIYSIRREWLKQLLLLMVIGVNLYLNLKLSKKWYESEKVISSIQTSPNLKPGKVKLLLNSPACIKGIPMIGTSPEGEFRLMHNEFFKPPVNDTMLEVAAYNMISPDDGAHVEVINDSTVKVTLNQWGTWWWIGTMGAYDYENEWFRLELKDPGHWYNLILKKPAREYDLLFQQGRELKIVDMAIRGREQY